MSVRQLTAVYRRLLRDIGTPLSLRILDLVDKERWGDILAIKISPLNYQDSESYFKDTVCVDFLRKLDVPEDKKRLRAEAVDRFKTIERGNKKTNIRLSRYLHHGPFEDTTELSIQEFLLGVKSDISEMLGTLPGFLEGRHGPGSTYDVRGLRNTIGDKVAIRPTLTPAARCLIPWWERTAWYRSVCQYRSWDLEPVTIRGNRFATVNKDRTKLRGICVEPTLNVFYQLGLGRKMRQGLRKWGVDMETAQFRHRRLARSASADGSLATIDLSDASDTVVRNLVRLLIRKDWLAAIETLRSPLTRVDKEWHYLEKFSSMGCGFTFELETVIFLALARGVCRSLGLPPTRCSAYGDDIIVPTEACSALLKVLSFAGFTANPKKTFSSGSFRESCGGDYFNGTSVRAHFVEEVPTQPHMWVSLANGIRRMAFQDQNVSAERWRYLRGAWKAACDEIPSDIRNLRGPVDLGDIVLHAPDRWVTRQSRECDQSREVRAYLPVSPRLALNHFSRDTQIAIALLGAESLGLTPRGGEMSYRIGWVALLECETPEG